MSESTSVLIKSKLSILEIKLCLEKILNCQLKKVVNIDWDIYSTSLIGLNISLKEADDFEDDRELNFSEFNYYLDIDYVRKAFDAEYATVWRRTASLVLADMISKNLKCECLVVQNMQELIKRYLPPK